MAPACPGGSDGPWGPGTHAPGQGDAGLKPDAGKKQQMRGPTEKREKRTHWFC